MFPKKIKQKGKFYNIISEKLTENVIKKLLVKHPNEIYAIVNENLEENSEPMLTKFLVVYAEEFEENVILYDISREIHTTITTELQFLVKGYIEFIDVGIVDRYPIKLYKEE